MHEIAVIGCGVIGLTTALEIQNRFGNQARVTIFADKFTPDTTSDIAAGLWKPYLLGENSEENVIRWSKATYDYLLKLWREGEAKDAGICLVPILNLLDVKDFTLPKWADISIAYNKLTDAHIQSLSKQYNRNFSYGYMYIGFTWEGSIFLPYLQRKFLQGNGTIILRHIERFNELEKFDVIVNCTGLEARNLSSDSAVVPIRGQILRVRAPWQFTMYSIQCDDAEESCYVIPNTDSVVLGGTKEESFDTKINKKDTQDILKKVVRILPSLENASLIKEVVGLRPSRNKVRLEEELHQNGSKTLNIVHNYGHGGAGVTISIGCAKDATDIVEKVLRIRQSKL